mmetsp:Transcript_26297/g.56471  ORF Transcript_26297/g.56471 Transcript_26297/m.56471 type:complete len:429 (+) Transcript_26297:112-1398(+)
MSAITDTKTTLTSNKQAQKGNKKRKRIKQSPEEQYQIESTERYKKLHHACSKHFHRDAKVVKSFECQKIVRSIKAANDSLSAQAQHDDEGDDEKNAKKSSKATKRLETLQQKLDRTKKLDLDVLVQVGLKRLGVSSLNPTQDADDNDKKAQPTSGDNTDSKASSQSEDPFYQTLIESMLQHKRLSAASDELNEKVTEYRQWTLFREAVLHTQDNRGKRNKKNKQQQEKSAPGNDTMVVAGGYNSRNKRGVDLGGHEGESGLFIGSLSGMQAEAYDDDGENGMGGNEDDGEGGYHELQEEEKKKNRPGQRARKAKAMAIEARKAGKTWDSSTSTNWREEKKGRSENKHCERQRSANFEGEEGGHNFKSGGNKARRNEGDGGVMPKEAQDIATMGKTWKEEGNAHPSWAAAAAQKSQGIAKFKGTKITFD